jgi:hypothetical protein
MVQVPTSAVTVYTPECSGTDGLRNGLGLVDINEYGPAHVNVAPATVVAVSNRLSPAQTGELLVIVSVGIGVSTTVTKAVDVQAPNVAVTVYMPALAIVIWYIIGFCSVEVKPPGPAQL